MAASAHALARGLPQWRSRLVERWRTSVFLERGPESGLVFLRQRRVFVLPTRAGLMLVVMLVALLLGSINYSLSLGFALTFFVTAIAWVAMFFTFRNLAYLTLRPGRVEPVFVGELAEFGVVLESRSRFDRFALSLRADPQLAPIWADVPAQSECPLRIPARMHRRGWNNMPRITLRTTFPLGLWRAWAYWHPRLEVLVFPAPAAPGKPLPASEVESGEEQGHAGSGADDYAGIRVYAVGDSPRHLAWKAMARDPEGRLLTKLFEGTGHNRLWLDLAALPAHVDLEAALAQLTRWVLDCEERELRYGLRLAGHEIAPGLGEAHRLACLTALAVFGTDSAP